MFQAKLYESVISSYGHCIPTRRANCILSLPQMFTLLPPFTLGIFERTCSSHIMLKYPQLYSLSQTAVKYNARVFWKMFLNSVVHSLLLFSCPLWRFGSVS